MTTYFSDFMLNQIAAGYTFPGKDMGIALLYSAAVVDDSTPTSLAGLKAAPGFQEVSKVACPTYGSGTGVLVTQGVNGVVLDATNHPGVVTVIYGSDWLPIGTGATAESVYVAAVVFYIVGPVAGVTDPWMMITTDPVGVVVDPGARITNTTKQLFSYNVRQAAQPAVTGTLLEPFNNFTTNNWSVTNPANSTIVAGRTGTAARISLGNISWAIPAGVQADTITIGFAYKQETAITVGGTLLRIASDAGATVHTRVDNNLDGSIQVFRYLTGNLCQSAPGVLTAGNWYYIELQVKLHDTTGFVIVRVNGVQVASATNVDTKNAGTKTVFDTVMFIYGTDGTTAHLYDDLYVDMGAGKTFKGSITLPAPPPTAGIVDAAPISLYQSPGTLDWESARVQHVYMFPQRVNWIPNPSFEDVGNFGWRSNGAMSRLTPGVDSTANHFVRTAGTVLESIAVPIASIFRFSAWVRSAGGQGIVFALDCLDDAYVSRGLVANGERPLYADWIRYDELLFTIDDTLAVVPHIEADGPFDCDLCLLESVTPLNTYYDGSSNTGLPGDFSWQAQESQSYSFWYNNRYVTAARLFGEYVTGPVTLPSLVLDWLPTGTAVYTHWDVLSQFDTKHPLKDWPSRLIP